MTKLLNVQISKNAAPQGWGDDNQLSITADGFTIHIGDLSLEASLPLIQSVARKIQGMGVNQVNVQGDWDVEQQWSFYLGLVRGIIHQDTNN